MVTKTFPRARHADGSCAWLDFIHDVNRTDSDCGRPVTFGKPIILEDVGRYGWREVYSNGAEVNGDRETVTITIPGPGE